VIDYEKKILDIVSQYLPSDDWWIFLFGSRAIGNADERADYDIGIFNINHPLSFQVIDNIVSVLEDSDIAFKIDIVDFSKVTENFRAIAGKKVVIWKKPKRQSQPDWLHYKQH